MISIIHICNKGLLSRIYKEFLKINKEKKKSDNTTEKWARDLTGTS